MKFFNKFSQTTLLLGAVSAAAIMLFSIRWLKTDYRYWAALDWNLFLAWIPLWIAQYLTKHKPSSLKLAFGIGIWLVFFPNAPYIITDLLHIRESSEYMVVYDTLMLFVFALAGLLTGLYSMLLVHRLIKKHWGEALSWLCTTVFSTMAGYGIFLGRVGRWNTWDIAVHPFRLIRYSLIQLHNPQAVQLTMAFSVILMLAFFVLYFGIIPKLNKATQFNE